MKGFFPALIEITPEQDDFSINWKKMPNIIELLIGLAALCSLIQFILTGRWY
jgi:hypothetical protein